MKPNYECSTCGSPATSYFLEGGESKFACDAHVTENGKWRRLDESLKETHGFGKKKK